MLVWACVATVIATMIIGFSWGGWVTGGTSRTMATAAGDAARGELASAICVERFNAAPDAAAQLVEFKAIPDNYKKRQFVEAGGWATMPGQTSPDRRGAEGCVGGSRCLKLARIETATAGTSVPARLSDHLEQGMRSMITFVRKAEPQPVPDEREENRFEQIRKAAMERHQKSDTDGTRRRARQTAEDNKLI